MTHNTLSCLLEDSRYELYSGICQVRRFTGSDGQAIADMICDLDLGPGDPNEPAAIVDPTDAAQRKTTAASTRYEDLLVPMVCSGKRVYDLPSLDTIRRRAQDQLTALDPAVQCLTDPQAYVAGLEQRLHELRDRLVLEARSGNT